MMTETRPEILRDVMVSEFSRVFGSCQEAEDGGLCADGWPDAVCYDPRAAIPTLHRFVTGHGLTEAGDAEVCRALELAGAVIR